MQKYHGFVEETPSQEEVAEPLSLSQEFFSSPSPPPDSSSTPPHPVENPSCCPTPNPIYGDGAVLPQPIRDNLLGEQRNVSCVPLKEIDSFYNEKQTFVILGRWGTIHRFSSSLDGHWTLPPSNSLRRFAIFLNTHWLFSLFIIGTLLVNCGALLISQSDEIRRNLLGSSSSSPLKMTRVEEVMSILDSVCLVIYCVELIGKVIAKGLTGSKFSARADPWVWLDLVVIWTGFFPQYGFLLHGNSSSWIRVFKLVPLVPKIRQASHLSVKAVGRLSGMILLLLLLLWGFSLLATQSYMGTLSQKCIRTLAGADPAAWNLHNSNSSNWLDDGAPCGNTSGGRHCPQGYVCLQGYGPNPDGGLTNFDNGFWSLLSVIRIGSEDFTEEIYRQILLTNGAWHMAFFVGIFFIVTVPMGCLFFSVLASLFQEWTEDDAETDDERGGPSAGFSRANWETSCGGLGSRAKSIISNEYFTWGVVGTILLDAVGIASYHDGIREHFWINLIAMWIIPLIVFSVYLAELILKSTALGPSNYVKNGWNLLDLLVLLTFLLEATSNMGHVLAPLRLLKLVQHWSSLRMIFAIYSKVTQRLWGWALLGVIVFTFIICIGPFELGGHELERHQALEEGAHHRWSYIDFWHSFRMVFRMQIAEWIETLWEIYPYAGDVTFVYYAVAISGGALFVGVVLVGVVHEAVQELGRRGPKGNRADQGVIENDNWRPQYVAYELVVSGLIIVSSVALVYEYQPVSKGVKIGFLVMEALFTLTIAASSIHQLVVSSGLRESVTSGGWLLDVGIMLENGVNLCLYNWSQGGPFLNILRSFRPLMLISRVEWLKAPFRGMKQQLGALWSTILATLFIWLIFVTFAVHSLAGLYYMCLDSDGNEAIPSLSKQECSHKNFTWTASELHFDNTAAGFLNMVSLVSRMGWVGLIHNGVDAVEADMAREYDARKGWIFYYIILLFLGGLGPMGILFSHLYHKFEDDEGYQMLLTKGQVESYSKSKSDHTSTITALVKLEEDYIPPPGSPFLRKIFDFVTNSKFDAGVMTLILLDMVILSFHHYDAGSHPWHGVALTISWNLILALYSLEMILKMICWRSYYFKSGWSYLDMAVVFSGLIGIFIYIPGQGPIRILRLVRFFRWLLSPKWGSQTVRVFISSLGNVRHALLNLLLLQAVFIWAFALLGHSHFADIAKSYCVDEVLNFDSFSSSLGTLILMLGFPCLEGLYLGLAMGGGNIAALLFVGSYAALTFLFLLNIYAVLVRELVWQMGRLKRSESET